MNKRGKKKFIEKHGYKRYRSAMYRYIRSWMVAIRAMPKVTSKDGVMKLGRGETDVMYCDESELMAFNEIFHSWNSRSEDNFIPYEPKPETGAVSGFIAHMEATDPSKVPKMCGTDDMQDRPIEYEAIMDNPFIARLQSAMHMIEEE